MATPWFFKTLTNFMVEEFKELCTLVVPTIKANARSTGLAYWFGPQGNWWPDAQERRALSRQVPRFPGCIGFIDGTLVKIRRPKIEEHGRFFNGQKKMYAYNNTVIVDHNGLFIHVDLGYPGSFHDVNILRNSDFHPNWRQYFTSEPPYIEYLLGDPGYAGEEQYIMRRVGIGEYPTDADISTIMAYNKMHAEFQIVVEWGIGGLKRKWHRLMKRYDCSRGKFNQLFRVAALLTNFLQQRYQVVGYQTIGEPHRNADDYGWLGDF